MYDLTPKTRRHLCPASITLAGASAAGMIAADLIDSEIMFHAALIGFLIAATVLICVRTGVNAEILEHARQAGYDAGYQDGQSVKPAPPTQLRQVI